MGNSPSGPRLLQNGKYSYHIKLGNKTNISVRKSEDGDERKEWELIYNLDGMTSKLSISRVTQIYPAEQKLHIEVSDCSYVKRPEHPHPREFVKLIVEKEKNKSGLLSTEFTFNWPLYDNRVVKYGVTTRGEVETFYLAYGCGSRMGLLVIEQKKKTNEERPYMVTVAHYYLNSGRGGNFGASGADIGFSIVVKIGVMSHNGELDFVVDGPVQHPYSALVYMIEEVSRTGTWKLSACPHCRNIQQQRRWLSESEDSDTPLPPPPPRYGGSQTANNKGQYNGDANGSIIQASKINFIKWWK